MSRILSLEKMPFSASSLGLATILFSGFVTVRPNRIAAGESVRLFQTQGGIWAVIILVWIALLTMSVVAINRRLRLIVTAVLSSALVPLSMSAAGQHAEFTTIQAGVVARTSLGPAFWVSVFAAITVCTDSLQRSTRDKNLIKTIMSAAFLTLVWMLASDAMDSLSIMREFSNRRERFIGEVVTHLALTGSSVCFAVTLGVPLGLLAHKKKRFYSPAFFTLNTLQTIPSLALFGILIPIIAAVTRHFPFLIEMGIRGIGSAPAVMALTVYSLLPVARNTYTGFAAVDPAAIEAGFGMGMTKLQLLRQVELPIASPVILNGIRVALVQATGLTAVAALIGAGGLGVFIFQGLGQAANDLILLGAVPTIFIAVVVDTLMNGLTRILEPEGLR